jgi:hypothetical protein
MKESFVHKPSLPTYKREGHNFTQACESEFYLQVCLFENHEKPEPIFVFVYNFDEKKHHIIRTK